MENGKKNLLMKKVKVFTNEFYLYFLEAYAWNAIKFNEFYIARKLNITRKKKLDISIFKKCWYNGFFFFFLKRGKLSKIYFQ